MKNSYFIINGIQYEIIYKNNELNILKKTNNKLISLLPEEKEKIIKILNSKYNYIYDSILLKTLVDSNDKIENKNYILNFLNWLENIIPSESRNNFYRNIKTLNIQLKLDLNFSQTIKKEKNISNNGGYNTSENKLFVNNEESLSKLWEIAKTTPHPEEFYYREFSLILLHELSHMASSNYDPSTKIALCGFDKYPASKEEDKNRGLTEGFTEIISMTGIPGTVEVSSGYYIEACITNLLIQLVGIDVFLNAYFKNLGIQPIKEKLHAIILDPNKTFKLFRDIELNFQIKELDEEQNILGNIQSTLLDYLEVKLEKLSSNQKNNEINQIINIYEHFLITSNKLDIMLKNPKNYIGIEENVIRFNQIKEKYNRKIINRKK